VFNAPTNLLYAFTKFKTHVLKIVPRARREAGVVELPARIDGEQIMGDEFDQAIIRTIDTQQFGRRAQQQQVAAQQNCLAIQDACSRPHLKKDRLLKNLASQLPLPESEIVQKNVRNAKKISSYDMSYGGCIFCRSVTLSQEVVKGISH
jgi:hypothetical protein